ncbi:uncharacterized protein FTJAE_5338 [Fusarium tjaetaba]|uniref:SET domain-containing protein n=1 Tax=Fusarium tjaetaba TaxID=1567544 RepID=A0A8H5VUS9_9HYPO|nr:uncharacterized protein FTJAE_5338 [Fusarium tjaetaba]KAF5638237.1 hypothetical protein FTJAE_5338 [Fusarium tjaetaba]
MTTNQSGGDDSEDMIQQSPPDEQAPEGQAPEDTNPANLSSNPPEAHVSTNEGESRNDSEHMIQQSSRDEQAPENANPANLSSNAREASVSTNDGESHADIRFQVGVFAPCDLPQGHKIIGSEQPLFEVPPQFGEPSAWRRKDLNPTGAECFDKFKRDHNCKPSITTAIISSLASETHRACPDCAQATFRIGETYDITLTLLKDVRKGDEICIGFGQTRTRFVCSLCKTRERTWKWRKRQLKRLFAKLYPRDMSQTAEPPSE